MRYLIYIFLFCSSLVFADSPNSFAQAKKIVTQLFEAHPRTIYCGCSFEGKTVDLNSCGMQEAVNKKRAHRTEVEHMMAAEHFGQQFKCWREPICLDKQGRAFKGRKCCQKSDERYRHIEAELYNLAIESGVINQARSNYRFGVLPQLEDYLGCSIKIDKSSRRVEPSDDSKGMVARAYLFMSEHYTLPLSKQQEQLFRAWNKQFPPTAWEYQWASQVAQIEGYPNPYITEWGKGSTYVKR
ncbi:endonuclease [Legionella lytica]|uniref:Endonuclease n=1 Tax=Legionella lytica TaxID=96232 RepID=A0ABW8DB61_9GAMM